MYFQYNFLQLRLLRIGLKGSRWWFCITCWHFNSTRSYIYY